MPDRAVIKGPGPDQRQRAEVRLSVDAVVCRNSLWWRIAVQLAEVSVLKSSDTGPSGGSPSPRSSPRRLVAGVPTL